MGMGYLFLLASYSFKRLHLEKLHTEKLHAAVQRISSRNPTVVPMVGVLEEGQTTQKPSPGWWLSWPPRPEKYDESQLRDD